jgi:hypothetical protein
MGLNILTRPFHSPGIAWVAYRDNMTSALNLNLEPTIILTGHLDLYIAFEAIKEEYQKILVGAIERYE